MKKMFLALLALVVSNSMTSQDIKYPSGIYLSIDEIISKNPSNQIELEVTRRTRGDIKMVGGNDYKLTSGDKSISKKKIRKQILGYSNGDTLFINCFKYKTQWGYDPIIKTGRFLVFSAGLSQDEHLSAYQLEKSKSGKFWAAIGGGIGGGISGAKRALLRFLYLIDTKNNELHMIDEATIRKLLGENNLESLKKYDEELKNTEDKESLIFKYLDILNNLYVSK